MKLFTADPHYVHRGILDYCNRPFSSVEEMDRERFLIFHLPLQIVQAVDRHNLYFNTPWGPPIRFVTLQRLKGRFVSPAFVRTYWKPTPPDPELVVTYSDYLARTVVLSMATAHQRHRQVGLR